MNTTPETTPQPDSGRARGTIPLAPDGYPFIIGAALATALTAYLGWCTVSIICGVLLLFILNFFRDFEQDTPQDEDVYVCPANGKVIRAQSDDNGGRIDIFMNVFDVHVNRAPMSGRITNMEYIEGKFMNADFEKACDENERNRFTLETNSGVVVSFVQISGLIARRIVSYVSVGDQVEAGQRVGMIRFGSRVDNHFPADFELCVKLGDKVIGGKTILARKKT